MVELGPHSKSFPLGAQPGALADIAQRDWNVLANDLAFPLAVLRRSALMHNLRWMQDFAQRKGVHLAPHGKTSMSPELFAMQLAAGAWGLSFATVFQLGVGVAAGVRRAIIANQVLGTADLAGLQYLLCQNPDLRAWFLVDSIAQLRLIEAWADAQRDSPPFDVLLEMGIPGQRTGCRTLDEALPLAQALAASKAVRLGGVECYEGHAAVCDPALDPVAVSALVRNMQDAQAAPSWHISALNDQHAFMRFDPAGPVPVVGERVALGLSHPCTTFDKWHWMPLIEDDGTISGAIHTCF